MNIHPTGFNYIQVVHYYGRLFLYQMMLAMSLISTRWFAMA